MKIEDNHVFSIIYTDMMAFPQKSAFNIGGIGEKCSICYIYRFAGQIPIVSCDNNKCALNYHTICLKTWFAKLCDTKVFLNMASGRCPSCKEVSGNEFNERIDLSFFLFHLK